MIIFFLKGQQWESIPLQFFNFIIKKCMYNIYKISSEISKGKKTRKDYTLMLCLQPDSEILSMFLFHSIAEHL
jgi:hypothetical protein